MTRRQKPPPPPRPRPIRCQRCGVAKATTQIQLKYEGRPGPLFPVCEKDGIYLQALYPEAAFVNLPPALPPALAKPDPKESADVG